MAKPQVTYQPHNAAMPAYPGGGEFGDSHGLTKYEVVSTQLAASLLAKNGKLTNKDIEEVKKHAAKILSR